MVFILSTVGKKSMCANSCVHVTGNFDSPD